MSYFKWYVTHGKKHNALVQTLCSQGLNSQEIIDYFRYENMLIKEPLFCPLYANKEKCHNIRYLNCYLCACPHFRFSDFGIGNEDDVCIKSECAIGSRKSKRFFYEKEIHLDCSACTIPHTHGFIKKVFHEVWQEIMRDCVISPKGFDLG